MRAGFEEPLISTHSPEIVNPNSSQKADTATTKQLENFFFPHKPPSACFSPRAMAGPFKGATQRPWHDAKAVGAGDLEA